MPSLKVRDNLMPTTILLIDLSSIAHPLFHVSASDPDPNATSIKTVERVRALASGQPHVAICTEGGKSFRKDLDPLYKANRPPSDAALQHQITLAIETLKGDGFPVWSVAGYEADDVIATAVERAFEYESEERLDVAVTIASADKDLLQLVGPGVEVHSLVTDNRVDAEAVKVKYGVAPEQIVDYLSLVGDASDNIKGAKNIGAKTAASLLQKYGTLEDLYTDLHDHGTQFTPALATSLQEFKPRMALTRELIQLKTDAPIPFADIFQPRVPQDIETFGGELDDIDFAMASRETETSNGAQDVDGHRASSANGSDDAVRGAGGGNGPSDERRSADHHGAQSTGVHQRAESGDRRVPDQPAVAVLHQAAGSDPSPVVLVTVPYERQLDPTSLRECYLLAGELFKSRLFSAYGTPQGILSTIIAGRELGFPAATSLRLFQIVEGKPAMSADMIRGLVQRSPLCLYFRCTERTSTRAVWSTLRKGDEEPTTLAFTLEQGRAAWQKDQRAWDASAWGKRPINMVTKSASSELARLVYADVVGNMYSVEELLGEE